MRHYINRTAARMGTACLIGTLVAGAATLSATRSLGDEATDQAADAAQRDVLTIGSPAPELDVEHWLHKSDDRPPVSEFEEGKVYVVEFWATWCGPCIASMPHLAELQQEYADKGVRLISISDEPLDTVQEFLKKPTPQDEDVTFEELTSAYSLTTDPDESAFEDYMRAAGQSGIPTAFLVGKTGKVEWIGHPMRMDEPLEQIVNDSWDREAFAKEFKEKQANDLALTQAMRLMREGKTADAVALLDKRIETTDSEESLARLKQYKLRALMSDPEMSDQAAAVVKDMLEKAGSDPIQIYQASAMLNQLAQTGEPDQEVVSLAIEKLRQAVKDVEDAGKPFLYDTMARLLKVQGSLDEAIAAEEEAVKRAEGPMKNRFQSFLDDLRAEAEGESDGDSDSE